MDEEQDEQFDDYYPGQVHVRDQERRIDSILDMIKR